MNDLRDAVRERYGKIGAEAPAGGCCGGPSSTSCGGGTSADPTTQTVKLGYAPEDLATLPEGANLGLGCGNPQAIAALKPGETVVDLGSGGGIDCFLAARQVGPAGRAIGVDMTPEMISRARRAAEVEQVTNVEFRLGEIEHLPLADASADVIISNCVVNLSTDKPAVYREAFRVLKPGGRVAISDVVATAEIPEGILTDVEAHTGCLAGASSIDAIEKMLRNAGFEQIRIAPRDESRALVREWTEGRPLDDYVISATIEAVRP